MKKAVGSIFGWNRRNFVLLGLMLSLAGFGFVAFKAAAQQDNSAKQDDKPGVPRRPETNVTVSGGGSSSWDVYDDEITTNGLPSGGGCDTGANGSGASIDDAQIPSSSDAFDYGGMVWVNNVQVGGALTQTGSTVNFATVPVAGLNATMQYYAASSSATMRVLITLHNPTAGAIAVPVDYATNFGSDGSTTVQGSSNGNTTFEAADRWLVTNDGFDGDPVNTTVLFGPGSPAVTPASVTSTVFNCAATNGAGATYNMSIPAGQTRSLMFFQKMNETTAAANSEAPTFFDTNPTAGSDLLSGLTATQLGQIANWSFGCTPTPVTLNFTGAMQTYTVPAGVTSIEVAAFGGQGGNGGGLGASITGTVPVTPGEVLNVLVGGAGSAGTASDNTGGGGGGGTFVVRAGNVPLVIAGGGGGFSSAFYTSGTYDPAISNGQAGNNGASTHSGGGGTGGNGGSPGTQDCCAPGNIGASGGSGFSTNGGTGAAGNGGFAYVNGGGGGTAGTWAGYSFTGGSGGFGGGAGIATDNAMRCGGGGGYSGGQGGSFVSSGFEYAHGGGGGSFNAGTSQTNTSGIQTGNGVVVITPGCPAQQQADLAITKTDGITNFTAPGQTTYTIVVTNNGPDPAVNAVVTDNFPAGVTVDNWTCLPQNQAFCTLAGAGNINDTVYIPVGGILTYTATATVAPNQTGQLINTATVTAPATVTDPNTANNSATDTNNFVVSISGNVKQFVSGGPNTNLAGVTMTLTGCSVLTTAPEGSPATTTTTDASGNYTFANIPSGSNCTITPSMSGKVFDPTSRNVNGATANTTGINFVAYNTGAIPRNIFVVNTHATPGNPVTVPLRMTAQGMERTMAFSLDYPIGVLFTPVVACGASTPGCSISSNNVTPGKLGMTITAAADVAAGLREIATVTFQTNVGFAPPNAALDFSTTPTAQSVRDAAGNELQKTFTNGFVVFVDGVESDVAARNTGDGTVLTPDVQQVRRFVVGTDAVNPAFNEFQRADSAPLATLGDGSLMPGDVVQAKRYSSRLDAARPAGGPSGTPLPALGAPAPIEEVAETTRTVRAAKVTADPGQSVTVGIELDPHGNELAAAFTLEYDPARLQNARVTLADGTPAGTALTLNNDDLESGRIGILIDAAEPLARGSEPRTLVNVTFDVAANSAGGEARIRFTDELAKRGLSDEMGGTLEAGYTDGGVIISGPEAVGYEMSGRVMTPDGRGLRGAQVTVADQWGAARTVTTSTFGYYRFEGLAGGHDYIVSITSRRYRFGTLRVAVNDNLSGVDFIAEE